MFANLWRCEACRVRYERYLVNERALPDGDARRQERLWASIVASARSPLPEARCRPVRSWRSSRPLSLLGAGAFAVLLLVATAALLRTVSGPVARGTTAAATGAPTVHFFRTAGDHRTEPVTGTIHPDDGILIGYSNPGAELSYLMVFAVDVQGAVHWYYPAYEQPGDNPAAPSIRTGALGVDLGEEIRHALPVGRLTMVTLFLRRPLRVEEVERMVSKAWRSHGQSVTALEMLPLPSEQGQQLSLLLEVRP
jgi:hypothetical protein